MARGKHEIPDACLEAANRFALLANEPGEGAKEIEPVHSAARREQPQ